MKQARLLKLLPTRNENAMKNDQEQTHITFGYDPQLEPGRYLYVPCDFLCSMHLSPTAKVLYLVLCSHANRGVRRWPSQAQLCHECAANAGTVRAALSELIDARLVSCTSTGEDNPSPSSYFLHALHRLSEIRLISENDTAIDIVSNNASDIHIPYVQQTLNKEQIQADTELLISKVGISEEVAASLAQSVAERQCFVGYVAEIVEYATTTPGIKNPAGCVVQLIRRGESRKPGSQVAQQGVSNVSPGLDEEKYTNGKYAFLFRPRHEEREDHEVSAETTGGDEERNEERNEDGPEGEEEGRVEL